MPCTQGKLWRATKGQMAAMFNKNVYIIVLPLKSKKDLNPNNLKQLQIMYLKYGHLAIKIVRWAGIRCPRYTKVMSEQLPEENNSARLCPSVAAGGLAKLAWTERSLSIVKDSYCEDNALSVSDGQSTKCSRKHRPWSLPLQWRRLPINFFLNVAKP